MKMSVLDEARTIERRRRKKADFSVYCVSDGCMKVVQVMNQYVNSAERPTRRKSNILTDRFRGQLSYTKRSNFPPIGRIFGPVQQLCIAFIACYYFKLYGNSEAPSTFGAMGRNGDRRLHPIISESFLFITHQL